MSLPGGSDILTYSIDFMRGCDMDLLAVGNYPKLGAMSITQ